MKYQRYGNIAILRSNDLIPNEIGEKFRTNHTWCESVYQYHTTIGENRRPILRLLAGKGNTITIFRENEVSYEIDLAKVMFSKGNLFLRQRLISQISNEDFLLDMFAAVGNLSLGVLYHTGCQGVLIEKDPDTFRYLTKNVIKNRISKTTRTLNIDCRNIEIENWATRVFLGYHNISKDHLRSGFRASQNFAVFHFHPLLPARNLALEVDNYVKRINSWVFGIGKFVLQDFYKVKKFSPGIVHVEVIANLTKNQ